MDFLAKKKKEKRKTAGSTVNHITKYWAEQMLS